jgi:thymidylate synthase (FAD)
MDSLFRVEVLSQTPNPQQLIYAALHQDYSEGFVFEGPMPDEKRAGEIALKRILSGELHAGPLEHPQITFNVGWFPHSVMQQARTHRIASFDVQCLTGDSEVTFVNKSGAFKRKYRMADLFDLWSNGEKAVRNAGDRTYRRDMKTRIRKMGVRSLDTDSNTFTINHIEEVVFSGVNPVFEVTLEDGKRIQCTSNHKLLTDSGWRILEEVNVGDSLMVNGVKLKNADSTYQNREWLKKGFSEGLIPKDLARKAGCSTEAIKKWAYYHKLKWEHRRWNEGITYSLNISEEERQRRRDHSLNTLSRPRGSQHPSWKKGLTVDKRAYSWLKRERKRLLEEKGGICSVCSSCHSSHHHRGSKNPLCAHPVKIASILYVGNRPTYDLVMKAPHHNFVCNDMVVHNSMRYTGDRIVKCAEGVYGVEEVFYLRPVGIYTDRQGGRYEYDREWRERDLAYCLESAKEYAWAIGKGASEEHARSKLAFDFRQHFVVSLNMRSLGHLLVIRGKKDAQLEIRQMCELMLPKYESWAPEIYSWFVQKQWQKGRLSL